MDVVPGVPRPGQASGTRRLQRSGARRRRSELWGHRRGSSSGRLRSSRSALTADGRIAEPQAVTPTIDAMVRIPRRVHRTGGLGGAPVGRGDGPRLRRQPGDRACHRGRGRRARGAGTLPGDAVRRRPGALVGAGSGRAPREVGDLHWSSSSPSNAAGRPPSIRANGNTDVNVLGVLAAHFGHIYCGVYAHVVRAGDITVGDPVVVDPAGARTRGARRARPRPAPRWATVLDRSAPSASVAGLGTGGSARATAQHRVPASTSGCTAPIRAPRPGATTRSRASEERTCGSRCASRTTAGSPRGYTSCARATASVVSGPFGGAVLDDGTRPRAGDHCGHRRHAGAGDPPGLVRRPGSDRGSISSTSSGSAEDLAHWHEVEEAVAVLPDARAHLFLTGRAAVGESATPGRPSPELIRSLLSEPGDTSVHLCGSAGFTNAMRSVVEEAGVARGQHPVRPLLLTTRSGSGTAGPPVARPAPGVLRRRALRHLVRRRRDHAARPRGVLRGARRRELPGRGLRHVRDPVDGDTAYVLDPTGVDSRTAPC